MGETGRSRPRWLDPLVALVLLGAAGWAALLVGVYTLDLDPNSDSPVPGVAEVSLVLLALGVLASLVAALVVRRWTTLSTGVLLSGAVAAAPWLSLAV